MSQSDSPTAGTLRAVPPPVRTIYAETDLGNGLRFVDDHGESVRYIDDWKCWIVFDGRRWVRDANAILIQRLAKETVRQMAADAIAMLKRAAALAEAHPDDERVQLMLKDAKKLHAWAKASHDMKRIRSMIAAACDDRRIYHPIGGNVFDRRPDLLNVQNGTVNLQTGKTPST